jgi:hypothetical protein
MTFEIRLTNILNKSCVSIYRYKTGSEWNITEPDAEIQYYE